ncbi:MAG: IS4 family transposase [Tolypothrix sp. T3-bin4]|nr:IS4 family transposase [Tolypothrix sp. T3-bin4]
MLPKFYQTHFQTQLSRSQFLVLEIILNLLSSEKQVRLERLARVFPYPITTESRRRKLQRFLDLPQLTITYLWFPVISYWLTTYCQAGQKLSLAIDRSQWGCINLLMVSLIWEKRAIPLSWSLLPKRGSSNIDEQSAALSGILPLFKDYKIVVLGDREFCSVDLANWLREQNVYFCLRLKRNNCIETENMIWVRIDKLGIMPGTSLYFQGVRVRKTKPIAGFDVACKWKRNYQGWTVDEAWFILTNLGNLPQAIAAYKQRMGIEEMFRDCKSGGYNLEGTGLTGNRLIKIILLMTISYSHDIIEGSIIQIKNVQKYVCRRKEPERTYRRRSTFGVGNDSQQWINYLEKYAEPVEELMKLTRNKRHFYRHGFKAVTLIRQGS